MKLNCWLIFAALFSTGLLAQQATNTAAPAPIATPGAAPAVTNVTAPASSATNAADTASTKKKAAKKKAATAAAAKKKAEAELRTVPLIGGPATVVANNVNVRGQAGLKGEVIGRITKGENVTVLEEIILTKSAPDEPSAWAKIALPSSIHVWVNGTYLETTNKTVRPRKLNIRGGPGENYSVLGTLKRGDSVKELSAKGDWLEIEAPADAYAFVAAQYLRQEATPLVAAVTPNVPATPEPTPTPVTIPETTPVIPPTENPVVPPAAETNTPPVTAPAPTPAPDTEPATPAVEEPLPPRIVQREGIVRGTVSIQAPTQFELVSPENGRAINYLHTTARDLDLRRYKGLRIVVTGEEGLDERWRNTPVLTIQRIQVLE
jgi:uncharacterized protein YgiM (DUF1202 family)